MKTSIKELKNLKTNLNLVRLNTCVKDPKVISYLKILQEQYVMCPIDKASNKIAFICKKYYAQVHLEELGF